MKISKFMKKNNGAISIFLAVVMVSMFIMSGIIVEGSRLRQAVAIVQSAADSAAMSVLAKYDQGLYDRYGLFVMDEETEKNIKDDYINFFMSNLSAELPDQTKLDTLFAKLANKYGYDYKSFEKAFDIYDFEADEVNIAPEYSIGSPQILQLQTTETAKYRSAFLLLQDVADKGTEISKAAVQQQKDVKLMNNSLEYRESSQEISNDLVNFSEKLFKFYDNDTSKLDSGAILKSEYAKKVSNVENKYNTFKNTYNSVVSSFNNYKSQVNNYNSSVNDAIEKQRDLDKKKTELDEKEKELERLKGEGDAEESEIQSLENEIENIKQEINTAKTNLSKSVLDLKNILSNIKNEKKNYDKNAANFETDKNNLLTELSGFDSLLESWSSTLSSFINEWDTLSTKLDNEINKANAHKSDIDKSDASKDVKKSAQKDADDVIKSLTAAKNSNAKGMLQATKNYIDGIKSKLSELKSYVNGLQLNVKQINIEYENSSGSIEIVEAASEPDYKNLSKIKSPNDSVALTPTDFFSSGFSNKFKAIQKPNGVDPFPTNTTKYYRYKTNIEHTVTKTNPSGVNGLQKLYETNKGKKVGEDNNSKAEDKEVPSDQYSNRPSANTSKFEIKDPHLQEDNKYLEWFKNKYGVVSGGSSGGGSGLLSGSDDLMDGLSSMSIGEDKGSQSSSLNKLDQFLSGVSSFFTGAQYDIMTYVYTMSMFKSRVSDKPSNWKNHYNNITNLTRCAS